MGKLHAVSLVGAQTGYTCFLVAGALIISTPFPYPILLKAIGDGTKGGVGGINPMILAAFLQCSTNLALRSEFEHLLKANSWWNPKIPGYWDMLKNSVKGLTGKERTTQIAQEKEGREVLTGIGTKLNQDCLLKGLGLIRYPETVTANNKMKPLNDLMKKHGPVLVMGCLWGKGKSTIMPVQLNEAVIETHTTEKFHATSRHAVIVCGTGKDTAGKNRYVYRDPGHSGHYRSKAVKGFPAEVEVWYNPSLSGGDSSQVEEAEDVSSSSFEEDAD